MALALLSDGFQSLPLLPTIKLVGTHNHEGSGAGSRVGGLVHALGPCGSLQGALLWGWEFLPLPPQPPQVFSVRGLRLYFPALEPWVVQSVTGSASHRLAVCPLCPSCPSPPLLPVWVSVSFLFPWLSDFRAVRFSVSSGCFLFLNCCCPSFGCARRHSVSTYTSILVRSLK